jgi:hypothetical protein
VTSSRAVTKDRHLLQSAWYKGQLYKIGSSFSLSLLCSRLSFWSLGKRLDHPRRRLPFVSAFISAQAITFTSSIRAIRRSRSSGTSLRSSSLIRKQCLSLSANLLGSLLILGLHVCSIHSGPRRQQTGVSVCWYFRQEQVRFFIECLPSSAILANTSDLQTIHPPDKTFYENEVFKTGMFRPISEPSRSASALANRACSFSCSPLRRSLHRRQYVPRVS